MNNYIIDDIDDNIDENKIENTIDEVLNNMTPREYYTLKEIEINKGIIIEHILDKYKRYPANVNTTKKEDFLELLKDYEYVDEEYLKNGDLVKYLDLKIFYDVALIDLGEICIINKKNIIGEHTNFEFIRRYKNIFFRKLTDEDLVKIKLIEFMKE